MNILENAEKNKIFCVYKTVMTSIILNVENISTKNIHYDDELFALR